MFSFHVHFSLFDYFWTLHDIFIYFSSNEDVCFFQGVGLGWDQRLQMFLSLSFSLISRILLWSQNECKQLNFSVLCCCSWVKNPHWIRKDLRLSCSLTELMAHGGSRLIIYTQTSFEQWASTQKPAIVQNRSPWLHTSSCSKNCADKMLILLMRFTLEWHARSGVKKLRKQARNPLHFCSGMKRVADPVYSSFTTPSPHISTQKHLHFGMEFTTDVNKSDTFMFFSFTWTDFISFVSSGQSVSSLPREVNASLS